MKLLHRGVPLFLLWFLGGCNDQVVTQRKSMVHVGLSAPEFSCMAVVAGEKPRTMSLKDLGNGYKIIFFYPADFTYVCPTELHAFQDRLEEFIKRNAVVIGVSVDTIETHQRWLATPKEQGGVEGITYPLLSDTSKSMCKDYDVLDSSSSVKATADKKALRGLFILDAKNIIHVALVQNMAVGRNIDEVLRLLDALIFTETHGAVCPAQWAVGKPALKQTHESVVDYFKNHKDKQ